MMNVSQKGIDLIKRFEGLVLHAYHDQVGVPTIGYGTIRYHDGRKVQMGDVITREQAEFELKSFIEERIPVINNLVKSCLNQNQYDSVVSFVYNLGSGAFAGSTLLKKINANPDDPSIRFEFMKWNKGRISGMLVPLDGLTKRRKQEADLYFTPIT
jgi:lysozyme